MKTDTKKKSASTLEKDDEVLRMEAMSSGDQKINNLVYRPVTALTVSWMQRNNVFDPEKDLVWKAAAYAAIHTEPMNELRAVINDKAKFLDYVDTWIEKNVKHHTYMNAVGVAMSNAFAEYMSSNYEVNPTGKSASRSGN